MLPLHAKPLQVRNASFNKQEKKGNSIQFIIPVAGNYKNRIDTINDNRLTSSLEEHVELGLVMELRVLRLDVFLPRQISTYISAPPNRYKNLYPPKQEAKLAKIAQKWHYIVHLLTEDV
jgi:hypothetical protein